MACLSWTFHSPSLRMATHAFVVLPEYPAQPQNTLILLHGLSGACDTWNRRTSIERYAQKHNLAVVMPEVQRSWYTDMVYGLPYFTFITDELPRLAANTLRVPVDPAHLYVGGLSMGGYGALKCALTYPERYAGCISLSARCSVQNKLKLIENDPGQIREWQAILGEDLTVKPENDLYALLARIQKPAASPRFYVACGTEDFLYSESVEMAAALRQTFDHVEYEEWPGVHDWVFWDAAIPRGLISVLPKEEKAE